MRSNCRLFFFSYAIGAYHQGDLIVAEQCRGCIFFSNLSEAVSKFAIPLHVSCHYLLLQSFLIFSERCRFSLFSKQEFPSLSTMTPSSFCLCPGRLVSQSLSAAISTVPLLTAQFLVLHTDSFSLMFCFIGDNLTYRMEETIL